MKTTTTKWWDQSINSVKGCTKISPGCLNCYACEALRNKDGVNPHIITFHKDKLPIPSWRRSYIVFMVSMSDLFHQNIPDAWIDKVFAAMNQAPHHKYVIITKRHERMYDYCTKYYIKYNSFPKCVWLGVTAEDQQRADERLPVLLKTPAYHHIVSVEPMLEPVKLTFSGKYKLDWVINGGENINSYGISRSNARSMNPDWARDVRDQCVENNVPYFMKQMTNCKKIPEDLQIQQYPMSMR